MTAHTILRAILVIVAVSHVVLGLLACIVGPATIVSLVTRLYGATITVTPQLHHVIRILGAFMIAIGIMSAFAIRDPERNRAIVYGLGILQILRAAQRVIFASQIQEVFGMPSGRLMLQSAFFFVLGVLLLLLAGAAPLLYGLAAMLDARLLMDVTGLLSRASYTMTPELNYARKPLGIYVAMFGALLLYTIVDPPRYRAVITWGARLLIGRGVQRLLIAGELHELFAIPFARTLAHVAYLCALGTTLLVLRPPPTSRT